MRKKTFRICNPIVPIPARYPLALCKQSFIPNRSGTGSPFRICSSLNIVFGSSWAGIESGANVATAFGHDLNEALNMSHVFEDRFLHIFEVAETSGRITESMKQQAEQYAEEAEFQLKALT